MALSRLPIVHKLLLMAVPPLLFALYFMAVSIFDNHYRAARMEAYLELSIVSLRTNALVHELQKERGATAIFMSSQGNRFSAELSDQRRETDAKVNALNETLASYTAHSNEVSGAIQKVNVITSGLGNLRQKVDALDIPVGTAVEEYTKGNSVLLSITSLIVKDTTDTEVSKAALAYVNLLNAKERAGQERAVISRAFSQDEVSSELKANYLSLAVLQSKYFELAMEYSTDDVMQKISQLMHDRISPEFNQMRNAAWNKYSDFGVKPEDWFTHSTTRINALKDAGQILETYFEGLLVRKEAEAWGTFRNFIILSVVSVLLSSLLSWYFLRLITRQLRSISSAMNILLRDSDLNVKADVYSEDELGTLADSFNTTVQHLKGLVQDMKSADRSLQESVETLDKESASVNHQVNEGVQQSEMASEAMKEMGHTVREVAENCSNAAVQSKQASDYAELGNQSITQVRTEMENLGKDLDKTNTIIQELAVSSEEIGSILDVIEGIAEQTNLLALNAAIEASRAGDAGRGFSVVAEEVRSLASKTQESTGQIQRNIEQIQEGSRGAVSAIGSSLERAESTDSSLESTLDSITNIIRQIAHVNDLNIQVATATEEQSSTSEEVNRSVQIIRDRYMETTDSAGRVRQASGEVNNVSQRITESVNRFKL
ncbi:methyl-accepting chemotaxis protein [Pseudoteredinibacter isoporae]|uniref:Methyl-accepting chemotaxis protein n=1 Tax=Pseudoteredinibacter isoporae TaxID=570281 RepID=A0A7X0JX01_9GAMM|nr:methyl-accepting chemotaxis protein [Pseudoteredinibacter isoporae]MBB6523812.1 methyl-accepting chemotaxis protein [Pseudoteredinibacter isoporae]NHO89332.1 methyl-accepting chemotaxis protein [Pseudoteredinibacter isoporae]NIB22439.1 methyl-accepting chemotaxis protein [Pseudoteredinibacter isoporae]